MGLLKNVSLVAMFWVRVLFSWGNHSVDATSDTYVHFEVLGNYEPPIQCLSDTPGVPELGVVRGTRCLYSQPVRFKENATGPVFSFSTKFEASLNLIPPPSRLLGYGASGTNGLTGFTFALLPHLTEAPIGDGGYMGLLNATSDGNPDSHIFAVEFDFVHDSQFSDPDDGFHIGIDVNSMNSTACANLSGPSVLDENHYWILQTWIDYDGSTQLLNVTTADITAYDCAQLSGESPPGSPASFLSRKVDLSNVLNEHMYVGFTFYRTIQASGLYINAVAPWSFRTSNSTGPAAHSASLPCDRYNPTYFQRHQYQIVLVIILVGVTAMAVIYAVLYKHYSQRVERRGWRFNVDQLGAADDPHEFTYRELALATKNFDPKQTLGKGGFGSVYKGFLPGNRQYVAVKRVAQGSDQGEREFLAEVMIIGKIRHRNLVRLQGWCHERGELLLVYDFLPGGSLDKLLFYPHIIEAGLPTRVNEESGLAAVDKTEVIAFPWNRRFKAIVDVATALVYLHTECEERIIHRDVKAANVMLDAKFNARLGDFGLARSYNHSLMTPKSTNVAGTLGYLAPELYNTRNQTEQTDVYSFGAFLMEVACGKKPIYNEDGVGVALVEHVWRLWEDSNIVAAADPRLLGEFNAHEMRLVLCLGLLCSHPSSTMRPSMRCVLLILNGDVPLPEVPLSRPRLDDFYNERCVAHELSWTTNSSSYGTASAPPGEAPDFH
ncbi:hypothetical protein KC19_2G234100 [Ceratodon purpureus]|uniref:Protein kinase domain-containing protein n=1 Tax=Ceratodon purpureus TaxID=3225 RepID=A0A8T0IZK4_CERPU|nr:hypothetical protein KC19_2G234100 [Ceratodon purpureus]